MKQWTTRNSEHATLRRWVGASGSLSARLARVGQRFGVRVLDQGRRPLHRDEARALGLARVQTGYVREVLLLVDGVPVVFARSVTAHAQSLGPWRSLRGLGTRPLADVLFRRRGITRTPLQFARLLPTSPLRCQVERSWQAATGTPLAQRKLAARRSVFRRVGAPLLVMEVFAAPGALPAKTQRNRWP